MLSATLDNLLNRGLPRSPRARQLCAQLEGRSVAIEIRAITRLRVASTGRTLTVTHDEAPADATCAEPTHQPSEYPTPWTVVMAGASGSDRSLRRSRAT